MPKIFDCPQRTAEWFKIRCGLITGSHMCDVTAYLANGKGETKNRANYRMSLVAERLTGKITEHFVTNEMKWGQEQEEFAISAYEQTFNTLVAPVGFAIHPTMDFSGSSPDGLIGVDGILEVKCLTTARHLEVFTSQQVPSEYYDQMQWEMVCCERTRGEFVCFDCRLPEHLQLFVIPVSYDEKRVEELEAEVRKMHAEVEAVIKRLAPSANSASPVGASPGKQH